MQYPSVIQYKKAIQEAESFNVLSDGIEAVMDGYDPIFASGNFATVFKMWRKGRPHALKCFLKEIAGREKRQKYIVDYIKVNPSKYFIDYSYLKEELWVDIDGGKELPVTWMEWIDAPTMGEYISRLCKNNDKNGLAELTQRFKDFAIWILDQDFAHGDIKHDNILIDEFGEIRLIDYDGMYVPLLKDQMAFELGGKDYQHPKRKDSTFNENLDDFSILIVYVSLLALSDDPSLYEKYNNGQNIIFSRLDFQDINSSKLVAELSGNSVVERYIDKIKEVLQNDCIKIEDLRLFIAGHMTSDEFNKKLSIQRDNLKNDFKKLIKQIDSVLLGDFKDVNDIIIKDIFDKREFLINSLNNLEKILIEGGNKITIDWWNSLSNEWKELFLLNIGLGNNIEEETIISEIIQLSSFKINFEYSNKIIDLYPLKNLINLRELSIQISKFELIPLSGLLYLNSLKLNKNRVSLEPLITLQSLEVLELPANKVSLKPLKSLINLKELNLKWNSMNLEPISKLELLSKINLINNTADLKPLQSFIEKGIVKGEFLVSINN